jgi:hypothetical protein
MAIAGALAPAIVASAAQSSGAARSSQGLGIQLLDAPSTRANDPRAHSYIIDHLPQGSSIERHVKVTNGTDRESDIALYPVGADIGSGAFRPDPGRTKNELADWITIEPTSVHLAPGADATATVRIAVPKDATSGERYAAVLAEIPPAQVGAGVAVGSRIGIRVYLSVGSGSEPKSDFEVDKLTADRSAKGVPVVQATVRNTGGRALDMSGTLVLDHGPGGLKAGPFDSVGAVTLAPHGEERVSVELDKALPNGPWDATLTMRSGRLEHTVTATIRFPDAGGKALDFDAHAATKKNIAGIIAAAVIALTLIAMGTQARRLRRRRSDDS